MGPKPNAPDKIRGPFKAIDTNVPGMRITEIFPQMARNADKFSLIRSVYHTATAVHDTGHQMMQTGRLFSGGVEHPHTGCVLGYLKGGRGEMPPHVLIPKPIGRTGGNLPHGQTAGYLGKHARPVRAERLPQRQEFTVPDLLPPDYISAVRAGRRQRMRDAVEGELAAFEPARGQANGRQFQPGVSADVQPAGPRGVRPGQGTDVIRDRYGRTRFGQSCLLARRLIEAQRALRDRQHVRDGLRREDVGHPRLGAVHRHRGDEKSDRARISTRRSAP